MSSPLDDPWDPGSLTSTSRNTAESRLAVSIGAWFGDPWRVNTATREIVGPGRQRLQIRLEEATGGWMLRITGIVRPGADTFEFLSIGVAAVLPPSRIATAIRLHLLPEYELAIARAFEARLGIEAAKHRLIAAHAERLALVLGPGWRRDEPESGTASVTRVSGGEVDTLPSVEGTFACHLNECELSLRIEWGLAEHLAHAMADYLAAARTNNERQRQRSDPPPFPHTSTSDFPNGDQGNEH